MTKKYFTCPVAEIDYEESPHNYTTEECKDCWCFWDCVTGLKECLKDDDFKEYWNELKEALAKLED